MDKKLKSKITSFQVLKTHPKDYMVVLKVHRHVDHCELCGSALEYSFKLKHNSSTEEDVSKDLFVGSDCVENFMEVYFPLQKENIRKLMNEMIDGTKSSVFLQENPDMPEIASKVKSYFETKRSAGLYTYANTHELVSEFWTVVRSDFYKTIMADVKSVQRKSYLSRPKIKKMRLLLSHIESGKIAELLLEIKAVHSKNIGEMKDSEQDFYQLYLSTRFGGDTILTRPALTVFEKQNFLKRQKIKTLKIEVLPEVY